MYVRYVGWKETIAESHFEDNRSADIIDLFHAIAGFENRIYTRLKIENKQNMLFYTLPYAGLNN
jgi:hypothetical protein